MDDIFKVSVEGKLLLQRHVEVYCWQQTTESRTERRGKQSRTVTDYTYTSVWLESSKFPSSDNFKDQKYNLNKAPRFESETFYPKSDLTVGESIKLSTAEIEDWYVANN